MTPEREKRITEVCRKRQLDVVVVLENVHDPHNVAAVVRSCDAVGVQNVFALYTDPTIDTRKLGLGKKTSAGARKWVDVHFYKDTEACVEAVRKHAGILLATRLSEKAQSIYDFDFLQSVALVFGNEHSGISNELLAYTDADLIIPQSGMVQSLNISVACAVTLFELQRQRLAAGFYTNNPSQSEGRGDVLLEDWFQRHETQYKGKAFRRPEQKT